MLDTCLFVYTIKLFVWVAINNICMDVPLLLFFRNWEYIAISASA
jgi:hypothetical protein